MGILDYFGLMTKKSFEAQIDALKREFMPFEYWQLQTADAERYTLPDPSVWGNQAQLFRRLPAVFISVDVVSSAAALTEFSVARVIQEKEPKDIPNHPFEMLLQQPNPLDSRYEFLYATIAYWMLNKNSYWWLNRSDEFSPPDEIWTIPPHMIQPIPDGNLFLKGYLYYPGNGAEIFLPPDEIIHFKGFNPFSRFVGLSAGIESLMLLAQSYLGMTAWNTKLYNKSNGRLPGILAFKGAIADPVWDKIKADTREAANNRDLLMLRGVGDQIDWMQAAATAKDMDFYAGLDKIDKVIMDVLAPGAYTMLFENANEANSRTGRATLNELAVYPKHVVMGEKITAGILPAYGSDKARPLVGHFKDIRVTDRQLEITEQQEYSKTHTVAEIREEFYGDDPLGDERDELLPDQIKPESGGIQEPEPPKQPAVIPGQQQAGPEQEQVSAENKPPNDEQKQNDSTKAVIDELRRWEIRAMKIGAKRAADSKEFLCIDTPSEIEAEIRKLLLDCKSETAVKMVFERMRVKVKKPKIISITPAPQYDNAALITLAESLNNLAATYKAQSVTPTMPNFFIQQPATALHIPPAENTYNFTLPNQEAPQTFVNITPQIEAAKTPDVHIANPVTIHQTVEPAPTPNVEAPITINQTVEAQEAPQVNVSLPEAVTNINVENKIPEQAAPNVTIENKVEPTPIKFDPTIETPAPNVTVVNEVKTPKVKRTRSKVARDEANNIEGQDTDYEYEDE